MKDNLYNAVHLNQECNRQTDRVGPCIVVQYNHKFSLEDVGLRLSLVLKALIAEG